MATHQATQAKLRVSSSACTLWCSANSLRFNSYLKRTFDLLLSLIITMFKQGVSLDSLKNTKVSSLPTKLGGGATSDTKPQYKQYQQLY